MKYDTLASKAVVDKTAEALRTKGYEVSVFNNSKGALEKIKVLIPKGKSVMNGTSVSLDQIGYTEYLKSGLHGWRDFRLTVVAETDPVKRLTIRKTATLSDYYLGSVNALTETGEFIVASNTGSQLPQIVFNSPNLIFVVGVQKIVPSISEAMRRLEKYVVPLEGERMKKLFGTGTTLSKILIFKYDPTFLNRKIYFLIVNEKLGY